jgi:hypothetical protein
MATELLVGEARSHDLRIRANCGPYGRDVTDSDTHLGDTDQHLPQSGRLRLAVYAQNY